MTHLPAEPGSGGTPRPSSVWTPLHGNKKSHTTSPEAIKVTIYVHEPQGGSDRSRPSVDGSPIRGGAPYVVASPDGWTLASMTIGTNAGSNDIVIVEEF